MVLEDLFVENLDLVVCGTAAGHRSAALKQYYAGRGNKFWSILAEVNLTPCQLAPSEYKELLSYGIGLTDVVKHQSGGDSDIDFGDAEPGSVKQKIVRLKPRVFTFNGKRAAQVYLGRQNVTYGLQPDTVGETRLFIAPSTSGAANAYWQPELWRELANLVSSTG